MVGPAAATKSPHQLTEERLNRALRAPVFIQNP